MLFAISNNDHDRIHLQQQPHQTSLRAVASAKNNTPATGATSAHVTSSSPASPTRTGTSTKVEQMVVVLPPIYSNRIDSIMNSSVTSTSPAYQTGDVTGSFRGSWYSNHSHFGQPLAVGNMIMQLKSVPLKNSKYLSYLYGVVKIYKSSSSSSSSSSSEKMAKEYTSFDTVYPVQGIHVIPTAKIFLLATPFRNQMLLLNILARTAYESSMTETTESINVNENRSVKLHVEGGARSKGDGQQQEQQQQEQPDQKERHRLRLLIESQQRAGFVRTNPYVSYKPEYSAITWLSNDTPEGRLGISVMTLRRTTSTGNGSQTKRKLRGRRENAIAPRKTGEAPGGHHYGWRLDDRNPIMDLNIDIDTADRLFSINPGHNITITTINSNRSRKLYYSDTPASSSLLPSSTAIVELTTALPKIMTSNGSNSSYSSSSISNNSIAARGAARTENENDNDSVAAHSYSNKGTAITFGDRYLSAKFLSLQLGEDIMTSSANPKYRLQRCFTALTLSVQNLKSGSDKRGGPVITSSIDTKQRGSQMYVSGGLMSEGISLSLSAEAIVLHPNVMWKVGCYVMMMLVVTVAQMVLSFVQLRQCNSPASGLKLSIGTVLIQSMTDALLSLFHLVVGTAIPGVLFSSFVWIAFFKLFLFSVFEMKLVIAVYQAR